MLGYDVPDQPQANAVVLINGNVVECVEPVEVPDHEVRAIVRVGRSTPGAAQAAGSYPE